MIMAQMAHARTMIPPSMRALTTFDVRWACDVLRPVYGATATGILLPARPYPRGII